MSKKLFILVMIIVAILHILYLTYPSLTEEFPNAYRVLLAIDIGIMFQLISHYFPIKTYRIQKITFIDSILVIIFISYFAIYEEHIAPEIILYLESFDSIYSTQNIFLNVPIFLQVIIYLLLADLFVYFTHRLAHNKYLWSTHAYHHYPKTINWVSGLKGSPAHYMILLVPYTIVACIVLLKMNASYALFLLILDIAYQHFTHTNIRLPYSKYIEYVFVTPRVHLGHHHSNIDHTNSNYGLMFTFWDRLFKTYKDPENYTGKEVFGIDYEPNKIALFLGFFAGNPNRSGEQEKSKE